MSKVEIDVYKKNGRYCLDIAQDKLLASESLGEIMDRIEKELKKHFDIKTGIKGKIGGMFGR